jgi:hypothetical protein
MKIDETGELFLLAGVANPASLKEASQILSEGKDSSILIPELRPYLIGLNYHVPILKELGIPFIYVTDNMVGYLFSKKKIIKTIFFYEENTDKGLWGATGSLYFCLLSILHKVPIDTFPGKSIKSEEFSDKDVKSIHGTPLITDEKSANYITPPKRELVRWEILGREKGKRMPKESA